MEYSYDENIVIVFLREERVFGVVLEHGAYASKIRYTLAGTQFVEWMENDDFIIYDNLVFHHVSDIDVRDELT